MRPRPRPAVSQMIEANVFPVSVQLGSCRLGALQPLVWRRSADQDPALPQEGDLPEGRGGGALPLPRHLPRPDPAVQHPGLPARVEHWILVTGGFLAAFDFLEERILLS